ncbi:Phosphopantetheine adenylyltransferase [Lachnospiraceae bacterium RM5]|nr:Phosphopantetheine adenylyltransferase [Lachnospiraceae bacterium RM5]
MKKIGIYPGSFDPVTKGHIDMIERAAKLFDVLYVAVLNNNSKSPLFSFNERVKMLEEITRDIPNVKVDSFEGLLVDYADKVGACTIVRGLRAVTDFEYEISMAQTNRTLNGKIDTVFLTTSPEYAYLSSSTVREVAMYGGDFRQFVPESVARCIDSKLKEKMEARNE